ncbi:MAG: sigma-54-dependent Fis family transcriptional regulator [Gemmatimonadetes bacterium]|nr:sigma-54-dependent Fis family transcriptional regulator [Gemmatimonadota bacterium]
MATILCVDDEPSVALIIEDALTQVGHSVVGAHSVPEALQVLAKGGIDLIISDYRMPGLTGLEFLAMLRRDACEVPLIMLTGYASIEHAVASIRAGAVDYITKPVRPQQLELAVTQALELVRLKRENEALRREVMEFRSERQIIGDSEPIRRLMRTVAMAAPTKATVLLQGESGTGKELFARAIHDQSERRDHPFVQLNCAALPEGLIESALFGHERGAFTGAVRRVEGAFERADGGTLLLDEISEMRLDLQAKLLRVLQEREFERVGGSSPVRVDVRIIATTNRDLGADVAQGQFRQDLYYRLSVIPMLIPPLRERPDDIPLLAHRFAMRAAAEIGKAVDGIAPETLEYLNTQRWPGNVRELQHAVERAVIFTADAILQPQAFESARYGLTPVHGMQSVEQSPPVVTPPAAPLPRPTTPPASRPSPTSVETATTSGDRGGGLLVLSSFNVAEAERQLIDRALVASQGNRTRAAELLGISVRTLRNKLNAPADDERIV